MNVVMERLRLAVKKRNLNPTFPPNDFEIRSKWTNIRNLLMRLTISNPNVTSPTLKDFQSVGSEEYCKVCFLPLLENCKQSHFECRAIFLQIDSNTQSPLKSATFMASTCQVGTLL
ncbi:hypothetical protein DSO57_1014806 [Entomophthora muscae]|uniref:Uncharacterized protein n=2 Tax=Entomophthora muscae TaxID=34485 RepID=A0ACC2RU63_9FUNG|nr:hypothetical protein DSO57_1022745 [Entomophthora muscae]KAJ9089260.1 hypothetical protein DSO57_1014806 [Entomophthora muscae]